MTAYHCEYCYCPVDVWKKSLKTYDGDECELYDSFSSLIEDWMTPKDLTSLATTELPKEFSDIPDIGATVVELVAIAVDCGLIKEG